MHRLLPAIAFFGCLIDAPRVPEVRPLQAHTSFGEDCEEQIRLLAAYFAAQPAK